MFPLSGPLAGWLMSSFGRAPGYTGLEWRLRGHNLKGQKRRSGAMTRIICAEGFSDFSPLDTLNTTLESPTVLVVVAGHYPTPLVLVVVTRVTRKTPAEPPPAAACPCPLERPRPAGR